MENKLILTEQFLLEERFILCEALSHTDLIAKAKELCEYANQLMNAPKSEESGNGAKEEAIEQIFRNTDKLLIDIKNVKDVDIVRGHAKDYIKNIKALIAVLDPDYEAQKSTENTTLRKVFYNIETQIASTDTGGKALKRLTDELNKVNATLKAIQNDLTSLEDASGNKINEVDQYAILSHIYEDLYKVTQMSEAEYSDNAVISAAVEKLVTAKAAAEADSKKISNFVELCKGLDEGDFGHLMDTKAVDRDAMAAEKNKNQSWAQKFKTTADKDVFWREYFQSVFGSDASKIAALGESFKQECRVLGFEEAGNPFITFVKNYIIDKGYPISKQHYEAIHNAVSNNKFLPSDLVNPRDPLTEDNNIMFWRDFYLKSAQDAPGYLNALFSLRYSISLTSIKQIDIDSVPEANKKFFTNLKKASTQSELIAVIMSSSVDSKSLIGTDATLSSNNSLRPLAEINQLLKALNTNGGTKPAWTKDNTNTLVAAIENNPPFNSNPKTWAKKFMHRLVDAQPATAQTIAETPRFYGKYGAVKTTAYSPDDSLKIMTELNKYGGVVSWEMLYKIAEEFNKAPRE